MQTNQKIKIIVGGIVAFFVLIIALSSFTAVGAGERGVILNGTAVSGMVFQPGWHLKTPFYQTVVKINVQTQAIEVQKSEAYTHDLQVVDIHSVINYNVDPLAVGTVYQQYGLDFATKVLYPNLEASIKQTVAKYTAEDMLAKRAEVQDQIEATLKGSVPPQFLITKYALVNEQFSADYEAAIERKQVAQQDAETAKNLLTKAQVDAQSTIAKAQGDAEAIKIQAQAINSQGGADYVQLQAIKAWDGHLPTNMIPGGAVPFLNLTN